MYPCEICKKVPNSHSFYKLAEEQNRAVFYSHDATSTDRTPELVLAHIRGELEHHHQTSTKRWVWIFNSKDFQTEFDINQLGFTNGMIQLIKTYQSTLDAIIIIHPTFFLEMVISIVKPFLDDDLAQLIKIQNDI